MKEYYIEILGNVEEAAEKQPTTTFAYYKKDKETTAIKAYTTEKSMKRALYNLYSEIGEVITVEEL